MCVSIPLLQSVTQLIGSTIGSQLIPVFLGDPDQVVPKYPRRTLYGLTAAMLLFIPAFALSVHLGGPAALITRIFLLFAYGG